MKVNCTNYPSKYTTTVKQKVLYQQQQKPERTNKFTAFPREQAGKLKKQGK